MGEGKQKIAVLGGGMGSLTTVFELTNLPDWRERYEITVYQLGWRLGGKGASGRGANGRIEEHGLHVWMGFYDNAFRVIRAAYKEMGRAPGSPLATWEDAFKKHSFIVIGEQIKGNWKTWSLTFPTNNLTPGDGGELPQLREYADMVLHALREHFLSVQKRKQILATYVHPDVGMFHRLLDDAESVATAVTMTAGEAMLFAAQETLKCTVSGAKTPADFMAPLESFLQWLWKQVVKLLDDDDELRRLWIEFDLFVTTVRGLIADGVLFGPNTLDSLDRWDYREWLKKHGATQISYDSGATRALYDLVFGYVNGDTEQPNYGAGVGLRSVLRIGLTYKGAVFYKMQAGMGDTVFTPLYQVLKARGVKFEFFHRVRNLGLSEDKTRIDAIRLGRQVTLKDESYDPLVDCEKLACWPSDPNFDQIVEGQQLKDQSINLESFWTPWEDVEELELKLGNDFDIVVLGISLGAFPFICPELIDANDSWRKMVDNVQTTRTQAMQLWLSKDIAGLGWTQPSPILDAYAQPLNTWADMSQLIVRESWEPPNVVRSIAYYCGPMVGGIPDPDDREAPAAALSQVKETGRAWLERSSGFLWPLGTSPGSETDLNYGLLVDPMGGTGLQRYDAQFWKANIDPSERYVLSVSGSLDYRLEAGMSGFENLFLTGDWTRNGFNAGCIEATVMAGMLAANAIAGTPALDEIVGYAPE
jgi:uncharacterized protein with NAD-binding domain and iron-sulfur cluster